MEDVGRKADKARDRECGAGVRNVLFADLVPRHDEHRGMCTVGLRARQISTDGVPTVVLERDLRMQDVRLVEDARRRRRLACWLCWLATHGRAEKRHTSGGSDRTRQ